jgi:hypothetical protein
MRMRLRSRLARWSLTLAVVTSALLISAFVPVSGVAADKKPSISLKANPPVGFSPLRVVVTAELKGGDNDYQDFYCASVEWDWGDDTRSQSNADCDPYEPGKSEIKRRYTMDHTFRASTIGYGAEPGVRDPSSSSPIQFRVKFLLKQKNKVVGSGQTMVEIRGGTGHE